MVLPCFHAPPVMFFLAASVSDPTLLTYVFLVLAILLALSFEFVNGFHDTANAVATVIYTNTLKATPAVVWSGIWNLIGVLTSSGLVAFGIVALLPVELVLNISSASGFAMVFSLLISAILWNLGTWYLGLPASSSHTLIGSILGVGLANSLMGPTHSITDGVNWAKAQDVGLGLLISPVVGFCVAALLLLLCKVLVKNPALYKAPEGKTPPPLWIRGILMITCTGVSFAHGSNDGQKGMGLIVLILVGILPGTYALKMSADHSTVSDTAVSAKALGSVFQKSTAGLVLDGQDSNDALTDYIKTSGVLSAKVYAGLTDKCGDLFRRLETSDTFQELPADERGAVRTDLYLISKTIAKMEKTGAISDPAEMAMAAGLKKKGEGLTNFIPDWVKYAVALALGLGTMIGYKRIVVTVGEKIGKDHLTYAQGASAELVAMSTIMVADHFGLPVSTTHVLSSGIAGTMAANKSGLQMGTLRNILMAWVLTLPVCIFLGALLFAFALNLIALLGFK
ncbi:MAG: anion permease [Verrucomicrobiaceae bacterium]|nr:MAG: anion permease [Verrucomicrobiaceae bacterium]